MGKRTYEGTLSLTICERTLYGYRHKGKWTFTCKNFPALAELYDGAASPTGIIEEFVLAVMREATNE